VLIHKILAMDVKVLRKVETFDKGWCEEGHRSSKINFPSRPAVWIKAEEESLGGGSSEQNIEL